MNASQHVARADEGLDDLIMGLPPHETMLEPFSRVMHYNSYQLHSRNTELAPGECVHIARLKKALDVFHSTLEWFSRLETIEVLAFENPEVTAVSGGR